MGEDWSVRSRALYETTRALVNLIVRSRVLRLTISGVEHVPSTGSVLLMSNHESNLDPVLIGSALPRAVSIPGKQELFEIPVFGRLLRSLGSYPVQRGGADAASLRRSLQVLRHHGVLVVFPEGRRSRTGEIGSFQPTLAKLAIRERTAVIPVGLAGTSLVLPPGAKLPKLGSRVSIVFGEELLLNQGQGNRPSDAEAEAAAETIRNRVAEARRQARSMIDQS